MQSVIHHMRRCEIYEKLWKQMKNNQNRRRTAGVPLFFMVFHNMPKHFHCFPWYSEEFSSFFIIFHNIPKHFHRFSCAPWYVYSKAFSLFCMIFQSIPKVRYEFSRESVCVHLRRSKGKRGNITRIIYKTNKNENQQLFVTSPTQFQNLYENSMFLQRCATNSASKASAFT